ncbi:MAG TPA: hypothetical protein DIU00_05120 [Phycisphaerales bacterium]|nr:hypothetical protein [Phycisphaerales bacterium]
MNVYVYMKRVYEDLCDLKARKNKANSKPIKACPFGKLGAGSDRSRMGLFRQDQPLNRQNWT